MLVQNKMPFPTNTYTLIISTCYNVYNKNHEISDETSIVDAALWWYHIPVELRKIICSYFGTENEVYVLVKKAAQNFFNLLKTHPYRDALLKQIPEINLDPKAFTSIFCYNWEIGIVITKQIEKNKQLCIIDQKDCKLCIIDPKVFYKCLKEFMPEFVPPVWQPYVGSWSYVGMWSNVIHNTYPYRFEE